MLNAEFHDAKPGLNKLAEEIGLGAGVSQVIEYRQFAVDANV